jgi:hypothetical protein
VFRIPTYYIANSTPNHTFDHDTTFLIEISRKIASVMGVQHQQQKEIYSVDCCSSHIALIVLTMNDDDDIDEALMDSIPLNEENNEKKKGNLLDEVPNSDHTSETILHAEEDETEQEEEEGVAVEEPTVREMSEHQPAAAATTAVDVQSNAASTDELDNAKSSSSDETREAWEKLRASSVALGKVLDDKTGFSYLMDGLKQQAVELDQQVHISETAKTASESVSSWWNTLDSNIGIRQTTSELASSVKEHIQPTLQESTRKLKTLDEKHHVLKSTAESLTKGADYLTQTLSQDASVDEADDGAEKEAVDTTSSNGSPPSSSRNASAPPRQHERPGGANV